MDRMHEGDHGREALEYLEKSVAVTTDPTGALQSNYQLGIAYQRLERWDDAAAAFRRVINLDPGYGEVYLNLGQVYRKLGQAERARRMLDLSRRYRTFVAEKELLETRQRARKEDPQANYRLGTFYLEAGARSTALPYLEAAVKYDPRHIQAYERLAVVYGLDGRREDEERVRSILRKLRSGRSDG